MSKVIKLGNYKGIEFKVEKVPVSNEEVEQQIQMILAQSSQTEEKMEILLKMVISLQSILLV